MRKLRLAVISTHPIQYYAPLFKALAKSATVHPRAFYTWSQTADTAIMDPGFGRALTWDIPLLEGYEYQFVPNLARRPGTEHFFGLQNPDLNSAIERWQADAILVFGWNCLSHLRALLYFKGRIPVFFRGDSTLLDRRSVWRALARRVFLTWVYRHVDVAIAVGSNNRDYFGWCGVREQRIAFAPHAVDNDRFSDPDGSHARRAAQWRQELGIVPDSKVMVFAGKMIPKKNPLLLLDAFLGCGIPGQLVFAGSGVLEPALRARAEGRSNVHFLPFQNQLAMPSVYRLGDVFVLPSCGPGETWGLALNEAMASGRAAIASTNVGGARDLVTHGVNGWVFESGDGERLAAIIRDALTRDKATLRNMGDTAARDVTRWSIDTAAKGIETAILRFGRTDKPFLAEPYGPSN